MVTKNSKKNKGGGSSNIAINRRAQHDYQFVERLEAGIALEGWEVKSLRDGRGQLRDGYVVIKSNEVYLIGVHITPLLSASTHVEPDPTRRRKLLLSRKEINYLIGAIERKGYTVVPLRLYFKGPHIKCEIALAKGKKQHDKRETLKTRDWQREQARQLKRH